jgi:hypothetical protein
MSPIQTAGPNHMFARGILRRAFDYLPSLMGGAEDRDAIEDRSKIKD